MYKERRFLFFISFMLIFALGLLITSMAQAQNWELMPPYNVLWPLWSPALSPKSPTTGLPTPLVTSLTKNTILPVQPAIAWDPTTSFWALYNTPPLFGSGLLFFDRVYGLNPWPPANLQNPTTGAPIPITYTVTWGLLPVPPVTGGDNAYFIPLANATYALTYGLTTAQYLSLLTSAQIWGLPSIVP
jgi:hypothetical protein